MRRRIVVLLAAAAVAALGAGCSSGSSSGGGSSSAASPAASPTSSPSPSIAPTVVTVDSVGVPPATTLKVGDKLVVVLNSNSTTGYSWKVQGSGIGDTGILKQIGKPKLVAPESDLMGAPNKTQYTFQAVKTGTDQLEFWYMPPGGAGDPGASYALIVSVGKGHLPVTVSASENYTAETAQVRIGDTLVVEIRHAASDGAASWKTQSSTAPVVLDSQKWSSANGGTATLKFGGMAAGSGTIVLVNKPKGSAPLQTYAVPVVVKEPRKPITIQLTSKDVGQTIAATAGDKIQATLPEQPSTGYTWVVRKPNPNVLKLSGKPKFKPNNDTIGAAGKTMYTYKVVGPGQATLAADYVSAVAPDTPSQTIKVGVAAKPGFKAKTVAAVADYPSETMAVKPGDVIRLELSASAGAWKPQGSSKALTAGKPKTSGKKTVVTYTAKKSGNVTSLLLASGSDTWPSQAYAFTTVIGKGTAPKTVTAAARRSVKPVDLAVGQTVQFVLPGNASTGYQWVVDPYVGTQVLQQVGDVVYTPDAEIPGSPGVFTATFTAVKAGSEPLTFIYQGPGDAASPDGIYMTWVNVQ